MIRIESVGSIWLIDEDLKRYMRMPHREKPRDDDRPFLHDLTWYPFVEWTVAPCRKRGGGRDSLHIRPTDGPGHICAPVAVYPRGVGLPD